MLMQQETIAGLMRMLEEAKAEAAAVLSPLPSGRWWCNHCGKIGLEGIMRRDHRVVPGPRR